MPAFGYFEERVSDSHQPEAGTRLLQVIRQDDRLYLQVGSRDDEMGIARLWLTAEQAQQFGKAYSLALSDLENGERSDT